MAWAEQRGGSWRIGFRFEDRKLGFTLNEVSEADAIAYVASTEELLRLLRRNVIALPDGCTIEDFLLYKGKPPARVTAEHAEVMTLTELRDHYLEAQADKLEENTLDGIRLHFRHLARILGPNTVVTTISRANLQSYVNKRASEWIDPNKYRARRRARDKAKKPRSNRKPPPAIEQDKPRRHPSAATIRKEIVSLRTAWNWARNHQGLRPEFPGRHLGYAKVEESLPFMTWDEAQRRVDAGGDPDKVWDCVFLQPSELTDLLDWVKGRPISAWIYPMFCFAAHTGARRSEIIRAVPSDLDLTTAVVTIREKKRVRRKLTTRQVPLSPFLKKTLSQWMKERAAGSNLFCKEDGRPLSPREAHNYFMRAVKGSKWSVLKGWHVFRHSFISAMASKGTDQRLIDEFVGHSTDEQRRRYRHIFPDVRRHAIEDVFA